MAFFRKPLHPKTMIWIRANTFLGRIDSVQNCKISFYVNVVNIYYVLEVSRLMNLDYMQIFFPCYILWQILFLMLIIHHIVLTIFKVSQTLAYHTNLVIKYIPITGSKHFQFQMEYKLYNLYLENRFGHLLGMWLRVFSNKTVIC